jgi:hypothetical protein
MQVSRMGAGGELYLDGGLRNSQGGENSEREKLYRERGWLGVISIL